jgi:CO dehydrogenase/acetyl-CoA synthase alpha subunit
MKGPFHRLTTQVSVVDKARLDKLVAALGVCQAEVIRMGIRGLAELHEQAQRHDELSKQKTAATAVQAPKKVKK